MGQQKSNLAVLLLACFLVPVIVNAQFEYEEVSRVERGLPPAPGETSTTGGPPNRPPIFQRPVRQVPAQTRPGNLGRPLPKPARPQILPATIKPQTLPARITREAEDGKSTQPNPQSGNSDKRPLPALLTPQIEPKRTVRDAQGNRPLQRPSTLPGKVDNAPVKPRPLPAPITPQIAPKRTVREAQGIAQKPRPLPGSVNRPVAQPKPLPAPITPQIAPARVAREAQGTRPMTKPRPLPGRVNNAPVRPQTLPAVISKPAPSRTARDTQQQPKPSPGQVIVPGKNTRPVPDSFRKPQVEP